MPFPPVPLYPRALDSDRTLYLVYDTAETKLSADNAPWALEVDVVPVAADEPEIWAGNGFANLDGELFYYDSVGRDGNGKVNRFLGCARQLGGSPTKRNPRGTWVRGYVVAEHHNQITEAVLKTEDFVGVNFDPRIVTLDWRIRNLRALDVIWDDFSCPDVDFTFNIVQNDPVTGILAEYAVAVTPPGSISSFRLDFGDGTSTTTALTGTHRYALNARVDPVVSVSNDKCQIVQTPIERDNPAEPPAQVAEVFDIPLPEVPDVPDFTFVPCTVPEPDINLPALVTPCISLTGVGVTGPSITLVSHVQIDGPPFPINITQSIVSIVGGPFPSIILVDPPIPPTIVVIAPPIPSSIVILPPPSQLALELDFTQMPRLEVDWASPPPVEVSLTMAKAVKAPRRFAADPAAAEKFGVEFADIFQKSEQVQVEYEPVGIPTEITIVPPPKDSLTIDAGGLFDRQIKIDASAVHIPTDITIHGPDSPIPTRIALDASDAPESIDLVYRGGPLPVEVTGMPQTVRVEMEKEIPQRVVVEVPTPIPPKITVEHNIPSEITYKGPLSLPVFIPDDVALPIKFPDKMPEMELVYRGAPIEVKVTMDQMVSKDAEGKPCFMMVPCKPN